MSPALTLLVVSLSVAPPGFRLCTTPNAKPAGSGGGGTGLGLTEDTSLAWKDRTTLKVKFLDGSPALRLRVEKASKAWTRYANLYLDYDDHPTSDIRISFKEKGKSYSKVGTDARGVPATQHTMNLGWFDDSTPDEEIRRTTLHEFGHAIGFLHEHQNPKAGIKWDKDKVYAALTKAPYNWSKDEVNHNLFEQAKLGSTNSSAFDPQSIMLYSIPKEWTTDGFESRENTVLSEADKRFAAKLYPWTPHSTVSLHNDTGKTLHFTYRWQGDKDWEEIAGKSLEAGAVKYLWSDAGKAAKFRTLEVRFDDGKGKTQTATLDTRHWKPAAVGDYPDFTAGLQHSFHKTADGRIAVGKK